MGEILIFAGEIASSQVGGIPLGPGLVPVGDQSAGQPPEGGPQ